MKKFNAINVTINELLSDKFFKLHIGQRRYEWKEKNVKEFVNDISQNGLNNKNYFIGTCILIDTQEETPNGEKRQVYSIIDGQQRITTICLILSVLKNIFTQRKENEENKELIEQYDDYIGLLNPLIIHTILSERGVPSKRVKVELGSVDNELFNKIITNKTITKEDIITKSHDNLISAHEIIIEELKDLDTAELFDFTAALLNRVEIIRMINEDASTAFELFKNINERSRNLEPSDLLKNLFLKDVNVDSYDYLLKEWDKFINTLTPAKKKRVGNESALSITNFLKYYIMSQGNYISKNGIFRYFCELNLTEEEIKIELKKINNKAVAYKKIMIGKENKHINNIRTLGFKQTTIVLLAVDGLENETDKKELSRLLENISFAYTIGNLRTNVLEKNFTTIAELINNGNIAEAKNKLKELINEDKEKVLNNFRNMSFNTTSKKKIAKYILLKIAEKLGGGDYTSWTIEHIMPEDKSEHWQEIINEEWYEKDYGKIVSNIGNLALLTDSVNSSIKGQNFNRKCEVYKTNSCNLTKSLSKEISTGTINGKVERLIQNIPYTITENWGKDEIINRAQWYSDIAKHIWFDKEI